MKKENGHFKRAFSVNKRNFSFWSSFVSTEVVYLEKDIAQWTLRLRKCKTLYFLK